MFVENDLGTNESKCCHFQSGYKTGKQKILPSTHRTPQRAGRVACWRRRLSPWFAGSRDVEDTYGTLTT